MTDDKTPSQSELVDAWINMAKTTRDDGTGDEEYEWAFDALWDAVYDEPDRAWPVILAILARDRSVEVEEMLSAGPLEDLHSLHGPAFIDRIEAEARRNPSFARLLGGVWQSGMTDDIWTRVQAVWDRRGWDNFPD